MFCINAQRTKPLDLSRLGEKRRELQHKMVALEHTEDHGLLEKGYIWQRLGEKRRELQHQMVALEHTEDHGLLEKGYI